MNAELDHIWSLLQAKLAAAVDEPVYRIWLSPLQAAELRGRSLLLRAPDHSRAWIQQRFGPLLQDCATQVLGPGANVELTVSDEATAGPRGAHRAQPAYDELARPRLSFQQFVIGDCNRLAHGAALAVAEMPSQAYNPLFICGPPGVGKTHLLQSIAALLMEHQPWLKIRSVTGEAFTNQFVHALGQGAADQFKEIYRSTDVLLVDDVQFLERKTHTEEEFFHTFDALHESGAQIVLSSDRPPRDLQALEDRLRERFQAGLVAEISPPDYTTRLAILRMRAHNDHIDIADGAALELLAARVTMNVRALEGALIRIVAYSSLTGRPLTPELAGEVLDNLYPQPRRNSTIDDIKRAVCDHYGITPEELVSPRRTNRLLWPRQIAMYLARELTPQSLPAIGREFGGRDHTTVLNACRRADERLASDASISTELAALREKLMAPR